MEILILGPFAEEYSLAKVNRGLALAADKLIKNKKLNFKLKISAIPEAVAKLPDVKSFAKYPGLKEIYEPFNPEKKYDIVIHNNFPKDPNALFELEKINSKVKLAYIAWEEDRFPKRWVDEFNKNLDAVLAASEHTRIVLKRSGINLPILILPNALDEKYFDNKLINKIKNQKTNLFSTNKKFTFYHNSSGMERKGVRELISAYTEEFSAKDNVALIIKSFPNINNLLPSLVSEAKQKPNCPEIKLIESGDLSEEEMIQLYLNTDVYVSPSKAEGFNLPVLEAMALEKPVITTAWSGQTDFANDENSYLIDYELGPAKSHLDNPGAFWAEVDIKDLKNKMRLAFEETAENKNKQLINNAKKTADLFTWDNSATKLLDLIPYLSGLTDAKDNSLGVITTYNTICGIAEYSSFLYETIGHLFKDMKFIANQDAVGRVRIDDDRVKRLWEYGEADFSSFFEWFDEEKEKMGEYPFDLVHIQYSEGFYTLDALAKLIKGLDDRKITTLLTSHAFQVDGLPFKDIKKPLQTLEQIHVLNKKDTEFLQKDLGLNNIVTLAHGNMILPQQSKFRIRKKLGIKENQRPVIASHGFMSEGKGILETLEAIALLKEDFPDLLYLAINAVNPRNMTSQGISDQFTSRVKELALSQNIIHISDFIEKEEVILGLAAADVVIFAYPKDAKQTASGAVRLAMAAARPIIATDSFQLQDLKSFAYPVSDNKPELIAGAVNNLLKDKNLYYQYYLKCLDARLENYWDKISLEYMHHISSFIRGK